MNALAPMMNSSMMNPAVGLNFPGMNNGNFGGACSCGQQGNLPGLNGNSMFGQNALNMAPGMMQQAMLAQQLQAVEFLIAMMAKMMMGANGQGQQQNGQSLANAMQPNMGNNPFGPASSNFGTPNSGQCAAPSNFGNSGMPNSSPTSASNQTGVPAANYNGPIDVEKIVKALPASNQQAARTHFPGILAECQNQGVTDKAQIAYILATTVHESGAGAHMTEFASGNAYNGRSSLGNTQPGDGPRFKGRGYVQVTGRNNYTNWSQKLGVDLVGNPELASQPGTAARILVQGMKEGSFTGKKLGDYVGEGRQDFEGARRVVNGTDKAGPIADTARKILSAMN